jgi:hypothetical protein
VPVRATEFSEEVRRKAGSNAVLDRVDISIKRLLNVLEREQIAGIRTLEMKICDAGPLPQRVEPHVLGLAGLELLKYRRRVAAITLPSTGSHLWYAPIRFTELEYGPKLRQVTETYLATADHSFTSALGDPLEISVFKILRDLRRSDPRFMFFGSFDLSARNASGRFRKIEPTTNYNEAALDGPPDFAIFDPVSGESAIIECKNQREWVYPSSETMKTLVAKALAAQMTPIIIARRMSAITKFLLCEPAGILAHETYNQLYPETEQGRALAEAVKKIRGLGYFDVHASEKPLPRTVKFFFEDVPLLLPTAAQKFRAHADSLHAWIAGTMSWRDLRQELAGEYVGPDHEMDF